VSRVMFNAGVDSLRMLINELTKWENIITTQGVSMISKTDIQQVQTCVINLLSHKSFDYKTLSQLEPTFIIV
jgi:hypothetical protein